MGTSYGMPRHGTGASIPKSRVLFRACRARRLSPKNRPHRDKTPVGRHLTRARGVHHHRTGLRQAPCALFLMFVLILIVLVLISAFFSVSEIALAAARRTKLQVLSERGDRRATKVMLLKEEPGNFFTIVQIGVNSVAILAGILGEQHVSALVLSAIAPYFADTVAQRMANIGSFLVVTLLFIQFADLIPKRIAMTFPERCAVVVIEPILTLLRVLKPVVWIFNAAADAMLKLLGIPTKPVDQITTEDIAAMVD